MNTKHKTPIQVDSITSFLEMKAKNKWKLSRFTPTQTTPADSISKMGGFSGLGVGLCGALFFYFLLNMLEIYENSLTYIVFLDSCLKLFLFLRVIEFFFKLYISKINLFNQNGLLD